jgi:serine/threonine protein kinase
MPSNIPPDAANLIKNCIVVNPIKRLTMAEIMEHPWFLAGLPKYLRIAPQTPNLTMNVESLSYILAPQKEAKAIPESSRPIPELVDELVEAIGVSKDEVLESLGAEGDNAIKVAYNIAKDKRRKTLDCESKSVIYPLLQQLLTDPRSGTERMRTQEEVSDVAATTSMMSNLMVGHSLRRTYIDPG